MSHLPTIFEDRYIVSNDEKVCLLRNVMHKFNYILHMMVSVEELLLQIENKFLQHDFSKEKKNLEKTREIFNLFENSNNTKHTFKITSLYCKIISLNKEEESSEIIHKLQKIYEIYNKSEILRHRLLQIFQVDFI